MSNTTKLKFLAVYAQPRDVNTISPSLIVYDLLDQHFSLLSRPGVVVTIERRYLLKVNVSLGWPI
jgi:hypothetical protein